MKFTDEQLEKLNFHILSEFNDYCWLSGGAISDVLNGVVPKDVDVCFDSKDGKNRALTHLIKKEAKFVREFPMGYKVKYGKLIVDLTFIAETPTQVFEKYDYTVVCAALDKYQNFYCHDSFFQDLKDKKLNYLGNSPSKGAAHPASKALRLKRYIEKGFTIDKENLLLWLENRSKTA